MNWVLSVVRRHHFICPMLAAGESVVSLTERAEELSDQDDQNLKKRYMRYWDVLPSDRQTFLLGDLDTNITPKLVYKRIDYKQGSQNSPDFYLGKMEEVCSTPLRGELVYTIEDLGNGARRSSLSFQ